MKIIDCSACIGYSSINRLIINHENYPVYEKVKQPKDAAELLAEMDELVDKIAAEVKDAVE